MDVFFKMVILMQCVLRAALVVSSQGELVEAQPKCIVHRPAWKVVCICRPEG